MSSLTWQQVAVFGLAIVGVVVPYVLKSPEAAAIATAIVAMLPPVWKLSTQGAS